MRRAVIASFLSAEAISKLNSREIEVISFGKNNAVGKNVAHHADLSFLYDGQSTLFVASEMEYLSDKLNNYCENIVVIPEKLSCEYPYDVPLNCVPVGKFLICNTNTVSKIVLQHFIENGYDVINVNQGYTKCSVVPVSDNAIITDDNSIGIECEKYGLDVLVVSKGSVKLSGFDYGFIGGTSGKISKDEIAFNGSVELHSNSDLIKKFLCKYGVYALSLTDDELEDIGSIIPLYTGG